MKKSCGANILLCFFGFLILTFPSHAKAIESSRNEWSSLDYISNGETVHLEMPINSQVLNDGSLLSIVGFIGNNQLSTWIPIQARAGIGVDQAISMVTAIIQRNGGYIREVKKTKINNQWLVDLDGGCPKHLLILKGRIILTPKNVFYLEVLSSNGNNMYADFFQHCWIR